MLRFHRGDLQEGSCGSNDQRRLRPRPEEAEGGGANHHLQEHPTRVEEEERRTLQELRKGDEE